MTKQRPPTLDGFLFRCHKMLLSMGWKLIASEREEKGFYSVFYSLKSFSKGFNQGPFQYLNKIILLKFVKPKASTDIKWNSDILRMYILYIWTWWKP